MPAGPRDAMLRTASWKRPTCRLKDTRCAAKFDPVSRTRGQDNSLTRWRFTEKRVNWRAFFGSSPSSNRKFGHRFATSGGKHGFQRIRPRRFLKQAAALAAWLQARGSQGEAPAKDAKDAHVHPNLSRRGARMSVDHITYYTPLQDYAGIITPAPLHFVQYHASISPRSMRRSIGSRSTAWWIGP